MNQLAIIPLTPIPMKDRISMIFVYYGRIYRWQRGQTAQTSFSKLWEEGTEYVSPERFHSVFTSKQLKVKPKSNNISGLQIADIIAHPSRNEILSENDLLDRPLAPFAKKIIDILQNKYYRHQGRIFGKKFI